MRILLILMLAVWPLFTTAAQVSATDSTGNTVTLAAPAKRIVSLAPHTTELLFSAGAGDRIVAAVDYSDFPEAAKKIPRIGGYNRIDIEAVIAQRPDLIVGWKSGNNAAMVEKLQRLGIPVFLSEPKHLSAIADEIDALAVLAGTSQVATPVTQAWRKRLDDLRQHYRGSTPVTVFYEVWNRPMMTVNGQHLISEAMALCGGRNVFAQLPSLAAQVSVEAVIAADPQVIIASGMGEEHPEWLDDWRRWPAMTAVKNNRLYFIPPALLQRNTLRILDGTERICGVLESARGR